MNNKPYLIVLIFATYSFVSFGQYDTIKKYNLDGVKTGYCKVYLDNYLNPTDSSTAFFYGYDLYDHGKVLWKYEKLRKYGGQGKFIFDGKLPDKGQPIIIDGKFSTYHKFGPILEETLYKNGCPAIYKIYSYYPQFKISKLVEVMTIDSERCMTFEEYRDEKLYQKTLSCLENGKWKRTKTKY